MAKKAKFHCNPETLSFERVETSARNILKKIFDKTIKNIYEIENILL